MRIDEDLALALFKHRIEVYRRLDELEEMGVKVAGPWPIDAEGLILDSFGVPPDETFSDWVVSPPGRKRFCRDAFGTVLFEAGLDATDEELRVVYRKWVEMAEHPERYYADFGF